jgi:intracellular sulfur oxidation DsrE/DsrF family protein
MLNPTRTALLAFALAALLAVGEVRSASGQGLGQATTGPVIDGFGAVYDVPVVEFEPPANHEYKAVFDVGVGEEDPAMVNRRIETLARFLNMHGRSGVPLEAMKLAIVLHGTAGVNALQHAEYRERFGVDNPNLPLLAALDEAGVEIYLCGQTAMHRGLPPDRLAPQVRMALSAMTVLIALQADGYALIAF